MTKVAKKFASAFCFALAMAFVLMLFCGSPSMTVAQTGSEDVSQSVAALADVQPQWRYTREGWLDANEWAMAGKIEGAPDRRFDNLHPAVLAMLILFSTLCAVLWASNEWELAQLIGERNRSQTSTTD